MAQTWTFLAAYTPFDFIQNTSAYREMSLPLHLRLPEPRQGGDGHWLHKKPRIPGPPPRRLQLSCPIHYSGLSSVPANIHETCELLPTGPQWPSPRAKPPPSLPWTTTAGLQAASLGPSGLPPACSLRASQRNFGQHKSEPAAFTSSLLKTSDCS